MLAPHLLGVMLFASTGAALPAEPVEPPIRLTLPWLAAQLVPSPEVGFGEGAVFGLRWQVTPLLWSFGLHRALSPWRFFVVDPIARHSGSLELHLEPEYLAVDPDFRDRWFARGGVRAYFPLAQRGEYLSLSLGSSYFRSRRHEGAAYELGVYAIGGFVGLLFAYAPAFDPARYLVTFRIRVF